MDKAPKQIKRINSHVGLSRYMETLKPTQFEIARRAEIPSPYAYSPTHTLYQTVDGLFVFIVETAHKRYDVFSTLSFPSLEFRKVESEPVQYLPESFPARGGNWIPTPEAK